MLQNTIGQILQSDPLVRLIQKENFVGWVYQIGYDRAMVLTSDLFKARALGVPQNCFLVAATFDPDQYQRVEPEDREVILLRVTGSAKLPQDDDMVRSKIDFFQQQESAYGRSRDPDDITLNQLQFGGLECRVLGTFYTQAGELWLGSDLESFAAAARLHVHRPRGTALEMIVNHIDPLRRQAARDEAAQLGIARAIDPFRIGTVRYTSTARLHRRDAAEMVPVFIQPSDFLARRTAVLGMTRTGKSNMVKQTVAVVKRVADESAVRIGQIIYDMNGEYANANQQDRGSIADVFPNETVRYRMLPSPGFLELRNNFYDQLQHGFIIIDRELRASGRANSIYVGAFLNLSLDEPDRQEVGEHRRWERRVAAYQTLLYRAGFEAPANHRVRFTASQQVRAAVDQAAGRALGDPTGGLSLRECAEWFEALWAANRPNPLPSTTAGQTWVDDTLQTLLDMLRQRNNANNSFISGYQILADVVRHHSPRRTGEVSREIYQHLLEGRIVILDLSVGDPTLRETISKGVAQHIFDQNMAVFVRGDPPPNIVVYIEEAHNLIGEGMKLTETWPRLAKEGAKYRIALVYATQEVSSVHPNILANTENWFVTHLNNQGEIKELADFYDFGDFSLSLLRAQDVGFARMKTLSGPYVVPVQIDRFDPEAERRRTAGEGTAVTPRAVEGNGQEPPPVDPLPARERAQPGVGNDGGAEA